MNTLILSSSLSSTSKSFILCKALEKNLLQKGVDVTFIDARDLELNLFHRGMTSDMEQLALTISKTDNIIIGMGVHCYSINDSLKVILDSCFGGADGKFFGIICAAGGDRSYLSTMHLTQICMNEWRMIQLPRTIVATGKDFNNDKISNEDLVERLGVFTKEFIEIGNKLLVDK